MKITIGTIIKEERKRRNISLEVLANALGVSVQAVSKWETDNSYPDITLLPEISIFFSVSLNYLFFGTKDVPTLSEAMPDDNVFRIVQYKGNRLLTKDIYDPDTHIKLNFPDETTIMNVEIWGSADINGNIGNDLTAGGGVNCGDVDGDINTGGGVNCGDVGGDVNAGGGVNCGDINGDVNSGNELRCGDINGDIISCDGDIYCGDVGGDISCTGNVTIN